MELYTKTSYELSERLTMRYSTSFGQSSRLFSSDIRRDIFAIYGMVRIADEIVDTYDGGAKGELLTLLENDVYRAIEIGYSANPIVHAFANTARRYEMPLDIITPFFDSMRMDITPRTYDEPTYRQYIYGSAEVIGLMCLKVFCKGDDNRYVALMPGAKALGSAYQKVNFLRDIASDFQDRGRVYFPGVTFETFDDTAKRAIVQDIQQDLSVAVPALAQLPTSARRAVELSYVYYSELLRQIEATPASTLKTTRIRISNLKKFNLLVRHSIKQGLS